MQSTMTIGQAVAALRMTSRSLHAPQADLRGAAHVGYHCGAAELLCEALATSARASCLVDEAVLAELVELGIDLVGSVVCKCDDPRECQCIAWAIHKGAKVLMGAWLH